MYVPTWRDNQFYASGRYRFDLRIDLERAWQVLGPDHVLLIRGHHHLANDVTAGTRRDFALNVTGYPNISELFLITDVLITDYSSVMFDFAVTGQADAVLHLRPGAVPDQLRGFCFDFEAEAPGPLLASSEEVLAAARDSAAATAGYAAAYQAFAAKYCPLDDGAGARVCDSAVRRLTRVAARRMAGQGRADLGHGRPDLALAERAGDGDAVVPVHHVVVAVAVVELDGVHAAAAPDVSVYPLKTLPRQLRGGPETTVEAHDRLDRPHDAVDRHRLLAGAADHRHLAEHRQGPQPNVRRAATRPAGPAAPAAGRGRNRPGHRPRGIRSARHRLPAPG